MSTQLLRPSEVDIRDAFWDEVYRLGAEDRDLVLLTDDMDAFGLKKFKEDFPIRFVNIGVAEQNMINLAAGLASCGKRVIAYGIASFITMRCFEQIKVNVCSMELPVVLVGVGAGFSFGFDGPTHHGTQDVAIMRVLPEMTIYNPSDAPSAAACARLAVAGGGPAYIRLDKGRFPDLGPEGHDASLGFRIVRPVQDITLVATGFMTSQALGAAIALEDRGVRVGVVDLYRIKPAAESFTTDVLARAREVVTVEENAAAGGIGSLVAEIAADRRLDVRVTRIASQDRQFVAYGSREWFHALNGLDESSIVSRVAGLAGRREC